MPRKTKEMKGKKIDEKREKKGVSQRVVVNVKVGETKRAKRKYTRRGKQTASTSDGARPGPTSIYSYAPAGLPPAPAYSIPSQMGLPALPAAFSQQALPGLSLQDVEKVGRQQAIGLLKEAEPAIRMAIEDISRKRANEAVIKAQGSEQRAELEKKFIVPVSKSPVTLAKEKRVSLSRMKGQPDMTPETFGSGMNEIQQELHGGETYPAAPVSSGTWRDVVDLTTEEQPTMTEPVIKIEPGTEPTAAEPKPVRRGRPAGAKNRPREVIQAEKAAKTQRKTQKIKSELMI